MAKGKFKKSRLAALCLILVLAGAAFFLLGDKAAAPSFEQATNSTVNQANTPKRASNDFKAFNGRQFEDLYNSFVYPNTELISEDSPITGNQKADVRIRKLALAKGYKLRSAPVADTFVITQKGMQLQQRAAQPWLDMKKAAKKGGLDLSLTAAYRSAKDQQSIFLSRLKGTSFEAIAMGKADAQVNTVLEKTALPGYSRHHTGYTVDIACDNDPGVRFEKSICFKWLSKNNYLNAKTYGWIPSYPSGAGKQGPEPEPWEYVWVGIDALK